MIGRMIDPYRNGRSPEWVPSLPEFLLARIAEDEALARSVWPERFTDRMLSECEAKRRIVALHQYDDLGNGEHSCAECDFGGYSRAWCGTLRLLAMPYVDHPDCREEWRP